MRVFPALDLAWPAPPGDARVEQLLAELDDEAPTALEERPAGVRVFFGSAEARDRAASRVLAADAAVTCAAVDVPDDDWAERSQANLAPITVGLLTVTTTRGGAESAVRPGSDLWKTTSDPSRTPDQLSPGVIFIKASMGFGTGHHASTRLCLELLQRIPLAGRRVLDIGTGSGILAIAAWRLGAASAVGLDHDADALVAARESVEENHATIGLSLVAADLTTDAVPGAPFDVVLANLTGALITREARSIARTMASGGQLIVSGVMEDEEASVTAALTAAGLQAVDRVQEQEWIGATFRTS
jgi:ribosomal protein L11 methyltransferase